MLGEACKVKNAEKATQNLGSAPRFLLQTEFKISISQIYYVENGSRW